jgi:hypothetical protein
MSMNIADLDFEYRPKVEVNHPIVGFVSFQDHKYSYCVPGKSYEVALFDKNEEWIVEPVDEFAEYHDGTPSYMNSAVYPHVPIDLVHDFLWEYRV